MDKKIVGLVGAISGLAALDTAQAAATAGPHGTELPGAKSYAELLEPIPNALAMLREVEATDAVAGGERAGADARVKVAEDHHHHHRVMRHHHHHHHRALRRHHHHHHHHHQRKPEG
jgi:hypothetical protein